MHVHQEVAGEGYDLLDGAQICEVGKPDRKALEERWQLFQRRCRSAGRQRS